MRAVLAASWLLLTTLCGAQASAYSEFNAGIATQVRNDALAVQHFSAALADPQLLANLRPVALLNRATAYQRQGKLDLALADYSASLALRPTFDAYIRRSVIYRLMSQPEPAFADVTAAIAVRPDLAVGYQLRSFFYSEQGRIDEAIGDLTTALAASPDDAAIFEARSNYYLYKGEYAAAMSDADKAIALSAGAPTSLLTKVAVYEAQGQFATALDALERVLGKSPHVLLWVMKKGILQWEDHKYDAALATFAQATQIAPSGAYPFLWLSLVRADAHLADTDAPDRALKVDVKKWPGPLVQLYLGQSQPETIMAVAGGNVMLRKGQLCEANFYIAQWQRAHGNLADATARLRAAVADCPPNFVERPAAANQLKSLP